LSERVAVAEVTIIGEPAEEPPGVTIAALYESMSPGQPKARLIVQEGARQEGLLGVAVRTQGPEIAEVRVSVTVDALGSRPRQDLLALVTMADFTGQLVVYPLDAKGPEVVVYPAIGEPVLLGVAPVTIGALLPVVDVSVTIAALLWSPHILIL